MKDLTRLLGEMKRDLEAKNRRFEELAEERGLSLDALEALAEGKDELPPQALRAIEEILDEACAATAPKAFEPTPLGLRI